MDYINVRPKADE